MRIWVGGFALLILLIWALLTWQTWQDASLYCKKLGGTYFGPGQCWVMNEGWNQT